MAVVVVFFFFAAQEKEEEEDIFGGGGGPHNNIHLGHTLAGVQDHNSNSRELAKCDDSSSLDGRTDGRALLEEEEVGEEQAFTTVGMLLFVVVVDVLLCCCCEAMSVRPSRCFMSRAHFSHALMLGRGPTWGRR